MTRNGSKYCWQGITSAGCHFHISERERVRLRGVSRTKSTSSAGHNCAAHYPLLDTGSAMLSRMHCIAGCSLQTYSPVHYTHHANTPDNISLCWIALHIISCTLSAAHSFQLTFHCTALFGQQLLWRRELNPYYRPWQYQLLDFALWQQNNRHDRWRRKK